MSRDAALPSWPSAGDDGKGRRQNLRPMLVVRVCFLFFESPATPGHQAADRDTASFELLCLPAERPVLAGAANSFSSARAPRSGLATWRNGRTLSSIMTSISRAGASSLVSHFSSVLIFAVLDSGKTDLKREIAALNRRSPTRI
jgi:hypothetical protein